MPITKLPISVNNQLDIVAKQTDTRLGIRGDHELELRLLASSGVQERVSDALLCHHRNDGRKLDLDLELTGHWVANVVVGGAAVNVGVALVNLEMTFIFFNKNNNNLFFLIFFLFNFDI